MKSIPAHSQGESVMRLGLGTAQFGLDYAIDHRELRPASDEVNRILACALRNGISVLDTANRYGDSEQVLGQSLPLENTFRIITKTPSYLKNQIKDEDVRFLRSTFEKSLRLLGRAHIYALIAHWAPDLLVQGGDRLFDAMLALRDAGLISKIGASVYTADHIEGLMAKYPIELIQVPVNLLDQRLIASGHLNSLKSAGVEIHARSAFLKGLILSDIDRLSDHFESIKPVLRNFRETASEAGLSPLSACLRFVLGQPEIDNVIVGVTKLSQLHDILRVVRETIPLPDFSGFAISDPCILNANAWPKAVLS